jgi:hypothetical protein
MRPRRGIQSPMTEFSCEGKAIIGTPEQADAASRVMQAVHHKRHWPYECDLCGRWHVTSTRERLATVRKTA